MPNPFVGNELAAWNQNHADGGNLVAGSRNAGLSRGRCRPSHRACFLFASTPDVPFCAVP